MRNVVILTCLLILPILGQAKTVIGLLGHVRDQPYIYRQTLQVILPSIDWVQKYHLSKNGVSLVEFAPKNQTLADWQQLVTIRFIAYKVVSSSTTLFNVMNERRHEIAKQCSNLNWQIIASGSKHLSYWWSIKDCGVQQLADQVEMAKIVSGPEGFSSVHYAIKTRQLTAQQQQQMAALLDSAVLMLAEEKNPLPPTQ